MNAAFAPDDQALAEAAWVGAAAQREIITPAGIVRWANRQITRIDKPPYWLIELSTLQSEDPADYAEIILQEDPEPLTAEQRISLILTALERAVIDLHGALVSLFRLWCPAPPAPVPCDVAFGSISGLLVEWDLSEDLDVLSEEFEARCRATFANHLEVHGPAPEFLFSLSPTAPSSC